MRKLAQELGVVPMALYKHVANKEELLDGMVLAYMDSMIGMFRSAGFSIDLARRAVGGGSRMRRPVRVRVRLDLLLDGIERLRQQELLS